MPASTAAVVPRAARQRRLPIGAEAGPDGTFFRVWAPASSTAAVAFEGEAPAEPFVLRPETGGYFAGFHPDARAGHRYRIRLDRGLFPDPASRFQPEGPHGPSEIVDPAFEWTDQDWRGVTARRLVIYELHLGTFTRAGTWRAALERLPDLARLGITMVEVMPVADFPGRFGWGYDGVDLFAPSRLYGRPENMKAFVDRAHALGLGVMLDVVYNHFGPDGNYLRAFTPEYFSPRYGNEWGEALNFDGPGSAGVREFFAANARYWIEEFHLDGLRLDATQQVFDESPTHILAEVAAAARAGAPGRQVHVIAENESQQARLARPAAAGGCALDALWNDDFHHAALVAATGRSEAYYGGYRGAAQEFVSCAKHGFLYQGQWFQWQRQRRGEPAFGLRPEQFVAFLENHDQVANSVHGLRLHQLTSPGRWRALTACLLLMPHVPMLFQGQEFAASAPFLYFADHRPDLASQVREGRGNFLAQFPSIATPAARARLDDPGAPATFERCRLDWDEAGRHEGALRLHADLLRLRRDDPALAGRVPLDGAMLGDRAFVLRFFADEAGHRLLVVNLGPDLRLAAAPEPLLAPPPDRGWRIAWSSDDLAYGGPGPVPLETNPYWMVPAESAHLLVPHADRALPRAKMAEKD